MARKLATRTFAFATLFGSASTVVVVVPACAAFFAADVPEDAAGFVAPVAPGPAPVPAAGAAPAPADPGDSELATPPAFGAAGKAAA